MLAFVFSPVRFFEYRLRQPPDWPLALLPLILCVTAQIVSALLFVEKLQPVMTALTGNLSESAAWARPLEGVSVVLVPFGYAASYAMAALALVCLDVVTGDSGHEVRLVEFAGLSFFTLVPYAIATVLIAIAWSPGTPTVGTAPSLEEIRRAIESQRVAMAASPLLSTGRLLSYYSTVWFVGMLSAALKTVTGLGTTAVWMAAAFLLALFVGVRLLGQAAGF